MIKKILATICAIGLIFASCFVGHKIDSKADSIGLGDTTDYTRFFFQYENKYYYNFDTITFSLYRPVGGDTGFGSISVNVEVQFNSYSGLVEIGQTFLVRSSFVSPSGDLDSSDEYFVIAPSSTTITGDASGPLSPWGIFSYSLKDFSFLSQPSLTTRLTASQPRRGEAFEYLDYTLIGAANASFSVHFGFSVDTSCLFFLSSRYGVVTSAVDSFNPTVVLPGFSFSTLQNPSLLYTQSQYEQFGQQQYNQGQQAGYNKGYSAGISDGGNNSFLSLITAVVDAPITAFTSLLDFDILGFNIKNVVLSILTAALVIACIRFFSGKFV